MTIKSQRNNLRPLSLGSSSIDDVIFYIEQHQLMIGFLYLFIENTKNYYLSEEDDTKILKDNKIKKFIQQQHDKKILKYQQKMQRLNFMKLKKYLYQKNRMIKCLKGLQPNIFNLSGIQIPLQLLQKHISDKRITQKLIQTSSQTKQLFRQLNKSYKELKQNYKSDRLITIQTPYDNFTKQIVIGLYEELNWILDQIDGLMGQLEKGSDFKNNSLNQIANNRQSISQVIAEEIGLAQQRCIEIMELMFLLANLQQRKVKKFDILNIQELDFQSYFQSNYEKIQEVYEYFANIKYPS